jgi:hypothetical protein
LSRLRVACKRLYVAPKSPTFSNDMARRRDMLRNTMAIIRKSAAPPPVISLNSIPSEFDILCRDHGGPLEIRPAPRETLAWASRQFFFDQAWSTFREWEPDRTKAMRIWPWVAFAAELYRFERSEKVKYVDEPTPNDVKALLASIGKDANSLCDKLIKLETLAHRLDDREAPDRRRHISWLYELIAQNLLSVRPYVDEAPAVTLAAHFAMRHFCLNLINVEVAASGAEQELSPKLLKRQRSQDDRGMGHLVARAAEIWHAMKGELPKRPQKGSGARPDYKPPFARFVTNIARLACEREPSLDEIATAFHSP